MYFIHIFFCFTDIPLYLIRKYWLSTIQSIFYILKHDSNKHYNITLNAFKLNCVSVYRFLSNSIFYSGIGFYTGYFNLLYILVNTFYTTLPRESLYFDSVSFIIINIFKFYYIQLIDYYTLSFPCYFTNYGSFCIKLLYTGIRLEPD